MTSTPETKVCPDCAEDVKAAARVCRFCGFRFDAGDEPAVVPAALAAESPSIIDEAPVGDAATSSESPEGSRSSRYQVAYVASILVWAMTVMPAGASLVEEDTTEDIVASYFGAAFASLAVTVLFIRLPYVYLRKRPFWSPWLFVVAAVVAVLMWGSGGAE